MANKKESKLHRAEYIILLIYAPLYAAFMITAIVEGEFIQMTDEKAGLLIVFILFLVVFILSWFKELLSGILFLVWVAGVFFVDLTFVKEDRGFGIISSLPIITVGILFIKKAIHKRRIKWIFTH